ncbi:MULTISPECIES: hypothetical protein [Planktothrix]|uniref:hypothetical protein n=1 Tax=Planktothrix TaxID=54304 RepID=UPI0006844950|nr:MULTISPECIES: hypothetical protein [Planktothrix]
MVARYRWTIQGCTYIDDVRSNEIQTRNWVSGLYLTVDFIRSLKPTFQPRDKPYKPIWEVADDIIKDIPEEVLSQLPKDGADNHNFYSSKKFRQNLC